MCRKRTYVKTDSIFHTLPFLASGCCVLNSTIEYTQQEKRIYVVHNKCHHDDILETLLKRVSFFEGFQPSKIERGYLMLQM